MKKTALTAMMALGAIAGTMAEDEVIYRDGVAILPEVILEKITHSGDQTIGYIPFNYGSFYYNPVDEKVAFTTMDYGKGYVMSDNGLVVGTTMMDEGNLPTIYNSTTDQSFQPDALKQYENGTIHSITPDGKYICGSVTNPGSGTTNLPFVAEIDKNGQLIGQPTFLPLPPKDFFGYRPQDVAATWLSSDGNRIGGWVKDSRGFFIYPIIFDKNSVGDWSYSLPTEAYFNMDHMEVPDPVPDMDEMFPDVKYVNLTDYMDEQQKEEFEAALSKWETSGYYEEYDPYSFAILSQIIGEEKALEYIMAENAYWNTQMEYNAIFEAYMEKYYAIVDTSLGMVQNLLTLSGNGQYYAFSAKKTEVNYGYEIEYWIPYLINLSTGEVKQIGKDNDVLLVNQVFDDGRMIASEQLAGVSFTYIYLPGEEGMQPIQNYIETESPEAYEWMKSNLLSGNNIVTSKIIANDNFTTLAGGINGEVVGEDDFFSFIMRGIEFGGVEELEATRPTDGIFRVYDLTGVKVMETKETSDLKALPKGIYIINGKKFVIFTE